MKAVNTIRLTLTDSVMYEVIFEKTAESIWRKLEEMYMGKSVTNILVSK